MYAYQWWADTSTGLLKLRNAANNAWITLRELDGTLTIEAGTVSAPGLAFASDLNTGIYSPSADQLAIATNGVERVDFGTTEVVFNDGGTNYDFRIEGDTVNSLFFVDASTDRVGLGTSSPAELLHVSGGNIRFGSTGFIGEDGSVSPALISIGVNPGSTYTVSRDIQFLANPGSASSSVLMTIKGQTGRVGIGTTTPSVELDVRGEIKAGNGTVVPIVSYSSTNTIFGSSSAHPVAFITSGTERARIDTSGRLLVGTSTSLSAESLIQAYKSSGSVFMRVDSDSLANGEEAGFFVTGGSRAAVLGIYKHSGVTNPAPYLYLEEEDGGAAYYWTDNSGQFRISSSTVNIGTTGGTVVGTQTSDERIKNILGPVEYGLKTLKQVEPVRYSLKSQPDIEQLGFIAQQVQPLVPQSVFDTNEHIEGEPEDAPTKLGMEYVALIPVLVNAIKELSAEVDELKAQLQAS
jgi:hypothetical protein